MGGGGVEPVDADAPPAEGVPDELAVSVPDEVVDELVEPVGTVDVVDEDVDEENGADPDVISIDDPPAKDTPGGPCGPGGPGGPSGPCGPGGPGGAGQSLTGVNVRVPNSGNMLFSWNPIGRPLKILCMIASPTYGLYPLRGAYSLS